MTVQITRVTSPELFVGSDDDPSQLLRIELTRPAADGALAVQVAGEGVSGTADVPPGEAFARWLNAAMHERVRLVHGLEHPGDSNQPDNLHRH